MLTISSLVLAWSPTQEMPADLPLNPFVIVPGLGGSGLSVTLSKGFGVPPACLLKARGEEELLFDTLMGLPAGIKIPTNPLQLPCFLAEFGLHFDKASSDFSGPAGVEVKPGGSAAFGSWNEHAVSAVATYDALKAYGLKGDETMFAAAYDWRLPDYHLDRYYAELKGLIERVSATNGGRRVNIAAQSNGPQTALAFLVRMPQGWKDKHIGWFVAEDPVFGGTPVGVGALLSYPSGPIRRLVFQLASAYNLASVPGEDRYTSHRNQTLVATPEKNYSAFDIAELLADMGEAGSAARYEAVRDEGVLGNFAAPNVDTYVVAGTGFPTVTTQFYNASNPVNKSGVAPVPYRSETSRDGDGTVPLASQLRGLLWRDEHAANGKRLLYRVVQNASHLPTLDTECMVAANGPDSSAWTQEEYGRCLRSACYVPASVVLSTLPVNFSDPSGPKLGFLNCTSDADCDHGIWKGGLCLPRINQCGAAGTRASDTCFGDVAILIANGTLPSTASSDHAEAERVAAQLV